MGSENQVAVALEWINTINIAGKEITIDLTKDENKLHPFFDPSFHVNHQYEEETYDYDSCSKCLRLVLELE